MKNLGTHFVAILMSFSSGALADSKPQEEALQGHPEIYRSVTQSESHCELRITGLSTDSGSTIGLSLDSTSKHSPLAETSMNQRVSIPREMLPLNEQSRYSQTLNGKTQNVFYRDGALQITETEIRDGMRITNRLRIVTSPDLSEVKYARVSKTLQYWFVTLEDYRASCAF